MCSQNQTVLASHRCDIMNEERTEYEEVIEDENEDDWSEFEQEFEEWNEGE